MNREVDIEAIIQRILKDNTDLVKKLAPGFGNFLAEKSAELWRLKAQNAPTRKDGSPSGWGERYANTIKVDKSTVYTDESHDDAMFVKMVEEGVSSWSIKDALLEGKAAARNFAKYGSYFVRVPFRWRTPTAKKPSSSFAGGLPSNVYEIAKKGGKIGQEFGNLAGLKRYGGAKHGQYFTFRTVSEKTQGWQHPGANATPVFDEVLKQVDEMIEKALTNLLEYYIKEAQKKAKG